MTIASALTAFLEYALSSASVRASTNRRRRFGRFAWEYLIRPMIDDEEKGKPLTIIPNYLPLLLNPSSFILMENIGRELHVKL